LYEVPSEYSEEFGIRRAQGFMSQDRKFGYCPGFWD